MKDSKTRPRKKIAKWQKVLTRAEREHLKDVNALTKKAVVSMNGHHNNMRNEAGAVEPCYWCKGIALKLNLPVSKLRPEVKPVTRQSVWSRMSVRLVDDNKPSKPWLKWYPEGVDMPFIYWVIALSTILWGIGCAVSYWMGVW